jgi:hypothetical protein
MKKLHQLVMAIAVLIALPLPLPSAMLCFLTGSQAQHACCRHMQTSCGAPDKSTSAGCCEPKTGSNHLPAVSPRPISFDQIAAGAGTLIPLVTGNNLQSPSRLIKLSYPPGPAPSGGTHLRI